MTQTLIEKLEALPTCDVTNDGEEIWRDKAGRYLHYDDLRAIIEQAKADKQEPNNDPVTVMALKITEMTKRISLLEDLLSSAYNIANRNGGNTHWMRFAAQLHINGITPVTAKTFKVLPSDMPEKAEQDDEAVAFGSEQEFATSESPHCKDGGDACTDCLMRGSCLMSAPNTYTEQDIDVAIGVVEWDKLNLFETAYMVKQIVMRFVGSQVTMEVKRLSEEEVAEIMDNNGAGWWTKHNHEFDYHGFADALMDKMTGGGK